MSETKRTKNIAFRLNDEEFAQIEKAATANGEDPNTWCRKMALTQSGEGHSFTEKRAPDVPRNCFVAVPAWTRIQVGIWPKRGDGCGLEEAHGAGRPAIRKNCRGGTVEAKVMDRS